MPPSHSYLAGVRCMPHSCLNYLKHLVVQRLSECATGVYCSTFTVYVEETVFDFVLLWSRVPVPYRIQSSIAFNLLYCSGVQFVPRITTIPVRAWLQMGLLSVDTLNISRY